MVLPFHHRLDLLPRALASVAGRPTLVVDDSAAGLLGEASVREALAAAARGTVEVVRTSGETGFARAVNAGLARAEALGWAWCLVLNDDAAL